MTGPAERDQNPAPPGATPATEDPGGDEPAASGDGAEAQAEAKAQALREAARRKRRLDEVFGDVLPETTLDEREPGHHGGFSAEHYRRSRPPHWGVKS